jgi:CBS domain-containing protein
MAKQNCGYFPQFEDFDLARMSTAGVAAIPEHRLIPAFLATVGRTTRASGLLLSVSRRVRRILASCFTPTEQKKEDPMRATEYFVRGCDPNTLIVRQIMEDAVVTTHPASSAMVVAELLSEHAFGSLPVVEGDGTLRGLVTEFDLLKAVEQGRDLRTVPVSDIMTREVVTTTEDTPLMNLIHLLQERHLIRVPVVKAQKLVGMVARRDVVFAYVKARAIYWP